MMTSMIIHNNVVKFFAYIKKDIDKEIEFADGSMIPIFFFSYFIGTPAVQTILIIVCALVQCYTKINV